MLRKIDTLANLEYKICMRKFIEFYEFVAPPLFGMFTVDGQGGIRYMPNKMEKPK